MAQLYRLTTIGRAGTCLLSCLSWLLPAPSRSLSDLEQPGPPLPPPQATFPLAAVAFGQSQERARGPKTSRRNGVRGLMVWPRLSSHGGGGRQRVVGSWAPDWSSGLLQGPIPCQRLGPNPAVFVDFWAYWQRERKLNYWPRAVGIPGSPWLGPDSSSRWGVVGSGRSHWTVS